MLISEKKYYPNILTVSGAGRNVGKTTLACRIIKRIGHGKRITAIKISPHFHDVDYKNGIVEKPGTFILYRENSIHRGKDSSHMLAAGAGKVYYLQTSDKNIKEEWGTMAALMDKNTPVIIESGGINEFLKPGISIFLFDPEYMVLKVADHKNFTKVISGREELGSLLNRIGYSKGIWKYHEEYD
jgi:hypothetical protein